MICQRCGMNNPEGTRFCGNCGSPMMQLPQKKSNAGLIIGIVIGCVLFLLVAVLVIVFGLRLIMGGKSNKEQPTMQIEQEVEEPTAKEEPGRLLETQDEEKQLTLSETPTEIFERFYEEELLAADGELACLTTYQASYVHITEGEQEYIEPDQVPDMYGVGNHIIRDLDGDGAEEMLVLGIRDYGIMNLWLYRIEGGQVTLTGEIASEAGFFDGADVIRHNYYLKQIPGQNGYYLVENGFSSVCVYADGTYEYIRVLSFENGDFQSVFEETLMGSEFSDMEDMIAEDARRLENLGFTASAASLDEALLMNPQGDGLELIFKLEGQNSELYQKYNDMYQYYETGDISYLGTMDYTFYRDQESFLEANRIRNHWIERVDYSNPDSAYPVVAFYDEVFVESDNPSVASWLNDWLNLSEDQYAYDASNEAYSDDSMYADTELYYRPLTAASVYYDDRYISVGREWYWFMGGVSNGGWESANFDWTTRRRVKLHEVLGMSIDEINEVIVRALENEFGNDMIEGLEQNVYEKYGDFNFYFDADNVYVCIDSYDLGLPGAAGWRQITFPRPAY